MRYGASFTCALAFGVIILQRKRCGASPDNQVNRALTASMPESTPTENLPPAPDETVELALAPPAPVRPREIGGRGGLEPTRYGDWEKDGRCIDF